MAQAVGGALTRTLRRHEQRIVLLAAALVLFVAALLPLVWLFGELPAAGRAAFALLGTSRLWLLLLRSLLLSAAVTAVSLGIGIPLGLLIGRMDVPGRRLLWVIHGFGMFLPPFVLALGWFHLLGRTGLVGNEMTAAALFSEMGLIAVLGLTFAPIITSLVALGAMGVDASLEEAARVVARPWRVATRILVPAAWPAVALGAIIVYALALSELGVPMFLRVDVFPAAVFARLGGVDYAPGEAFALALPVVPVAVGLLWLERRFAGRRSFAVLGLRGAAREPLPLGRFRGAVSVAAWLVALLSAAPIVALSLRAGAGVEVGAVLQWAGQAPLNSILAASLAASSIALLGLLIGHAVARKLAGAWALDSLAVLSFVMPSAVLGVGLIAVWNRQGVEGIYGSLAIVVIGFIARYAIVGVRVMASVVTQSPVSFEEAAASFGAGFSRRLLRLVLPLHARGMGFAWLLAMVFCLRDVETVVLFYPPGREPLTVRIFTLEANGPPGIVAGLGLLHVVITAAVLAAGGALLFARRRVT